MLRPETIKIQEDLAMYCRSGKETAIPGVTEGRLHHYRRLVSNVVSGTIAQAYPITRKVLSEEEWNYMFDSFFIEHDAQTPILWKLPYEFYLYASEKSYDEHFNKPWLIELLWFEWLEIEVHMMADENHESVQKKGDIMTDQIIINRDSRLIQLEYPVHLYPVHEAAHKKGNYYVFIYREIKGGTVRFLNLSVLHAWLIDRLINAARAPVVGLMPEISNMLGLKEETNIHLQLKKFLEEMLEKDVILGFSK
jgi:hypothetical protein